MAGGHAWVEAALAYLAVRRRRWRHHDCANPRHRSLGMREGTHSMSHKCSGSCPRDPKGVAIHNYILKYVSKGIVDMALVLMRDSWA